MANIDVGVDVAVAAGAERRWVEVAWLEADKAVLGGLGAEVIKVEAPDGRQPNPSGAGPLRAGAPDLPYNRVIHFNERNHSKLSVVLDLARPDGREQFLA